MELLLFVAAGEFGLPGLRAACERKICSRNSISTDNVIEVFLESTKYPVLGKLITVLSIKCVNFLSNF
jgi:hypothetical protein